MGAVSCHMNAVDAAAEVPPALPGAGGKEGALGAHTLQPWFLVTGWMFPFPPTLDEHIWVFFFCHLQTLTT